jgi:hypothetical protein
MNYELQSLEIDKLMDAIASSHEKYGLVIGKDAKGARNATYAKLDNILVEIHSRCSEFGLTLVQRKLISGESRECLETLLFHRGSKQWMKSLSLLHTNAGAQSPDQVWGGSDTYHRRYDAMGILGLCSSDDPTDHDGWKDHDKKDSSLESQSEGTMRIMNNDAISEKQCGLLRAKLNNNKVLAEKILARENVSKLSDISWKKFNAVLAFVDEQNAQQ